MDEIFSHIKKSPVEPVQLGPDSRFRFECHRGISCFNKCCGDLDIFLTPYDILRIKSRLGVSSSRFLDDYTETVTLERTQLPFIRLRLNEDRMCPFVTGDGCSIYDDRPLSCRYYPLGFGVIQSREVEGGEFYFLVKEEHCMGHGEDHVWKIREWRADQGIDEYDDVNKDWVDIILKKKLNPKAKVDERSTNLFFMGSYDLDSFRKFVFESRFLDIFDLDDDFVRLIKKDETELLRFAQRWLQYVLYRSPTVKMKVQD